MAHSVILAISLLLVSGINSEWHDLYKFPWTGVPLYLMTGIAPVNETRAYVAGGQSDTPMSVHYSDDNFQSVVDCTMHGDGFLLLDLDMGSPTQGVAGGVGTLNYPGLIYTANGVEFEKSTDIALIAGQQVVAIDPTTYAFIGGLNAFTGANGVALSKTGGRSWTNHPWKGMNLPANYTSSRYGAFPSANVWYVTGGSWPAGNDSALRGNGIYAINSRLHFDTKANKFVRPKRMSAAPSDDNGYTAVVAKTTDGGNTWELVYSNVDAYYLNGISCANENVCMAVGEGYANDGSTAPGARIIGTTDGGKTWTQQAIFTDAADASLMRVQMFSATEAWAAGGMATSPTNMHAQFYHTTDGGKTWTAADKVAGIFDILGWGFYKNKIGYATGVTEVESSTIIKFTA